MSPVLIRVSLLSSRYHAHPWGEAQHAMGGPEWPPSPWRLLRTIAACWFEAAEPPCSAEDRDNLLNTLGRADAPRIWIPKASFAEVPYYQPLTLNKTEKLSETEANALGKKTRAVREVNSRVLHYDHFAVVADPDVYFVFDVTLKAEQRLFLSQILAGGRYFGRAESRASFELLEPSFQKPDAHHEVRPAGERQHQGESIRRHVLVTTSNFEASNLWHVRQAAGKASGRSRSQNPPSGSKDHPRHLAEALIAAKKPVPDGTTWAQYDLPRAAIVHELQRRIPRPQPSSAQPAAMVVFQLFRRVPIPVQDIVLIARDFRDQAVLGYEQATGQQCILLSGREDDGSVARGNRHAYYLPQPVRPGGFLERFVVRLPGGENGVEQEILDALLSVTRLLRHDTYPVLIVPEEVRADPRAPRASRWCSLTPFLAPLRHREGRAGTEPFVQLRRALQASTGLTADLKEATTSQVVPVLSHAYGSSGAGKRNHRFNRRAAFSYELQFPEPVELRAAFGADAHFGLGQFVPVNPRSQSNAHPAPSQRSK